MGWEIFKAFIPLIIIIGFIVCVVVTIKKKKVKQKECNELEVSHTTLLVHDSGLPCPQWRGVTLSLKNDELLMKYNEGTFKIPRENITGARIFSETELMQKNKSVAGRAVVGGLLLGPLGAVIGGMSGIGTKNKEKNINYVVINYKSCDSDEIKILTFKTFLNTVTADTTHLINELKSTIKADTTTIEADIT